MIEQTMYFTSHVFTSSACPHLFISTSPFEDFMSGMGFLLSWDLAGWIGKSGIPANDTFGPEEKMAGKWLKTGNKAKYRFSDEPAMYDHLGTNGRCSHQLVPATLALHILYSCPGV
jgi:hypothetical protein